MNHRILRRHLPSPPPAPASSVAIPDPSLVRTAGLCPFWLQAIEVVGASSEDVRSEFGLC
jgi:hypothetical protein